MNIYFHLIWFVWIKEKPDKLIEFSLLIEFPLYSEIDQLYKICCVLGTPELTAFPKATNVSQLMNLSCAEVS